MNYALALIVVHTLLAGISAGHALLYKRDPRSALGWIAVCIAYPFIGALLYYMFGINRLHTRAKFIKGQPKTHIKSNYERPDIISIKNNVSLPSQISGRPDLSMLARSSEAVTSRPLVEGNNILPLFNGEAAYSEMLSAIRKAVNYICLQSYIFETDCVGKEFVHALTAATKRGVDVRVLLDGIGELYSYPHASRLFKKNGVKVAKFIPPSLLPPSLHINMRNHRKTLVVDGEIGFTGGMNIGARHINKQSDIHFKMAGPVVQQLQDVFDEDWHFATGRLQRATISTLASQGEAVCRVITDGPNEDVGKLAMIITQAIALSRKKISIMTPYFLPPAQVIGNLQAAALRGIEVDIILPQYSNQPVVHWATRNMLWELLQFNVNVYYQPPPFAHSKLFLIDDHYVIFGSANLDQRSLRLNFELVTEVFDYELSCIMRQHFDVVKGLSLKESLTNVDNRSFHVRLRDATAWLFSPYL